MKVLIITAAGLSGRFSRSVGHPCLKCIYSQDGIQQSLLYQMINQDGEFDYYVVVGGFLYEELKAAAEEISRKLKKKLILVKNDHYEDYGSGYSLYLGLSQIRNMDFDQAVFAEGDLYVDRNSFRKLYDCPGNAVTCSQEAILASKAVAFYFDQNRRIHYIYDTDHQILEVREPFTGIFNSGQIWKFADRLRVRQVMDKISEKAWQGTNLVFIQEYFGGLEKDQYDMVTFRKWINCNTLSDYKSIKEGGE